MNLQGKIRGFGGYSQAVLEKMSSDLGISIPIPLLTHCVKYYRNCEKRDPLIEELRMIDRFVAVCSPHIGISEFLTNNGSVARTYADAIAKRHILRPAAVAPITIEELSTLANQALSYAGKTTAFGNRILKIRKNPVSSELSRTLRERTVDSFVGYQAASQESPLPGDLFVLLRADYEKNVTRHGNAVSDFLAERETEALLKSCFTVSEGGLLSLLLSCVNGAQIDLTRLSKTGEPVPFSMIVDAYSDEQVVLIARQSYAAFAYKAAAHGLRLSPFASVTNTERFAFFQTHDTPSFALNSAFLRSLIPFRAISLALRDEGDSTADAPISHCTVRGNGSKYLSGNAHTLSETVTMDASVFASASCKTQKQFYRNAVDTAIAPILALAAHGANYTLARFALSLALPQADIAEASASTISMILGLYRVQTELGIPASATQIRYGQERTAPTLSVTAAAPEVPSLPNHFTKEGHGIYCLAPALNDDEEIDFSALRSMLSYLALQANEGAIKSVRLLCRESVTSVLQDMRTDSLTCRITDDIWACEDSMPLAILIESDRELLHHMQRVGVVSVRDTCEKQSETILPDHSCLLPTEHPSVTVISMDNDADGFTLAAELGRRGASVQQLPLPEAGSDAIARALLASDTVILCGELALPDDKVLRFAAKTFCEADGLVVLLGGAKKGFFDRVIDLPDGLSEKNLEKICKKEK